MDHAVVHSYFDARSVLILDSDLFVVVCLAQGLIPEFFKADRYDLGIVIQKKSSMSTGTGITEPNPFGTIERKQKLNF